MEMQQQQPSRQKKDEEERQKRDVEAVDTISIKIHSKHATAIFFPNIIFRQRKIDQSHAMVVTGQSSVLFLLPVASGAIGFFLIKKKMWAKMWAFALASEYQKYENTPQ